MRRPSTRVFWLAAGLLAVLAVVLFVFGLRRDSEPALVGATILGSAVVGGSAGYLAVADRDESELRAETDWRFAGPMVGCFVVAGLATVASALGVETGVGIAPVTISGIAFSGAFVAMACWSYVVQEQPRVALGEAFAALGWLLLLVPVEIPGLGPLFGAGTVLLVTGGSLAILFGPVGDAIQRRLEGLGVDPR